MRDNSEALANVLFFAWLSKRKSQHLVHSLLLRLSPCDPFNRGGKELLVKTSDESFAPQMLVRQCKLLPPGDSDMGGQSPLPSRGTGAIIPRFYGPGRRSRWRGMTADSYAKRADIIERIFAANQGALTMGKFVSCTKLAGYPSFFNAPLFRRIAGHATGEGVTVSQQQFSRYWRSEIGPFDRQERFFRLCKKSGSDAIVSGDLYPFINELLLYHPGLEFLESTPEFQEKYARTVVARIFYCVNLSGTGRISLRELRRSDLLETCHEVDEEEDINRVNRYFSYEHFYVLYCRFWELDQDHDFFLSRDDLLRYGGHALTCSIVDRIFACGRPCDCNGCVSAILDEGLHSGSLHLMSYDEFVAFMLSEEAKDNKTSLRYWFRAIDLDDDGVIRPFEMRHFYDEQLRRMESLGHELVPFEDVLCQMVDMMQLRTGEIHERIAFRLSDFYKKSCLGRSGIFFDILFNLNKFIAYEQRDPFMIKQMEDEDGQVSEWERFALREYSRLACAEEQRELDGSTRT